MIERVEPDPFNMMTRSENIKDGYKVTAESGTEYFKWFRKDGSVYGSPLGIKMVDNALALLEENNK